MGKCRRGRKAPAAQKGLYRAERHSKTIARNGAERHRKQFPAIRPQKGLFGFFRDQTPNSFCPMGLAAAGAVGCAGAGAAIHGGTGQAGRGTRGGAAAGVQGGGAGGFALSSVQGGGVARVGLGICPCDGVKWLIRRF